jgi:hypothetical protein
MLGMNDSLGQRNVGVVVVLRRRLAPVSEVSRRDHQQALQSSLLDRVGDLECALIVDFARPGGIAPARTGGKDNGLSLGRGEMERELGDAVVFERPADGLWEQGQTRQMAPSLQKATELERRTAANGADLGVMAIVADDREDGVAGGGAELGELEGDLRAMQQSVSRPRSKPTMTKGSSHLSAASDNGVDGHGARCR